MSGTPAPPKLPFVEAITYLSPEDILKGETEEMLENVQITVNVVKAFKHSFLLHREKLAKYFINGNTFRPWDFPSHMVFARLDRFLGQLLKIEDIFVTILEFQKLEKLHFGGNKGNLLNQEVNRLNEEFSESCKVFNESEYDPSDYNNEQFDKDYYEFKEKIVEFDRRLGSILCAAFRDCSSIESAFKVVAIAGYFLERPIIMNIFGSNYPALIHMFESELDQCKLLYDNHLKQVKQQNEVVNRNMPPISGNLKWAQELKQWIQKFWSNFTYIHHSSMESPEATLVYQKYMEMLTLLDQFEEEIYEQWKSQVDDICQFNLNRPLIKRVPDNNLLAVNFDPKLLSVLREVKYLKMLNQSHIPRTALNIYSKRDTFLKFIGNLDLVVHWYNNLMQTVLEVESPLLEGEKKKIDERLREAEEFFTWNEESCWDYIVELKTTIHDLHQRVQQSKDNIITIQKLMKRWAESPLFSRKDNRKDTLLTLDESPGGYKKYLTLQNDSDTIQKLVQENLKLLKAGTIIECQKIYMEYIDDIVIDGLFNTIFYSLNFLLVNTDASLKPASLFEVQMILSSHDIIFKPSLEKESGDNFYDLVEEILGDIFKMSAKVKRVAKHLGVENYQSDMDVMANLSQIRQEIMDRLTSIISKAIEYKDSFSTYSYLWAGDRVEFMRQFLLYGHVLSSEEIEAHAEKGVPERPPTLEQFKEQARD
ncbi:hypothetical protein NDU88_005599 [Pleurodeles waltl]|uniref:Dynein heavy chain tail domain-containing protein n=1 Tax=Pleurodeles waltl TaxID=8319 RepID=A0AAV7M9T2_PLEWA|nr:hypothetical protein NDU88_005599 [Pleurodeles waltl]